MRAKGQISAADAVALARRGRNVICRETIFEKEGGFGGLCETLFFSLPRDLHP